MIEIEKQIIMSEKFPAMTYSLSNHLHFDGIIDYGNNILLGQAKDILHLDNYTKRYFQELDSLARFLPDQAQPISLKEYTK